MMRRSCADCNHMEKIVYEIPCVNCSDLTDYFESARWIPCSVQEPPEQDDRIKSILVTMEDSDGNRFVTNTLTKFATKENRVVAWMPLPEPYAGGSKK